MVKVTIKTSGRVYEIHAQQGRNLLEVIRSIGLAVSSPCNGNGTCGKCKVRILSGYLAEALQNEIKLLGQEEVKKGWRLSCSYEIKSDVVVFLEYANTQAKIVTEGLQRKIQLKPIVTREVLSLEKPGLNSQMADLERAAGSDWQACTPNMELVRAIPEIIRQNDYNISLIKMGTRLLDVKGADRQKSLYGVAVDIGTTTIAVYLVDLLTGKRLQAHSILNPQQIYGADVISRIKHTMDHEMGLDEMHSVIINAINNCIDVLCDNADISKSDVYAVTLAGNTTMLHFLLKVSAVNIASAPFIPAITSRVNIEAKELGIEINSYGIACILPAVSAYIGADTVAAVLSADMYNQDEVSLLIDIGTNGEIVLACKDNLYACSSAAGPAFEGANIRNGMGSVSGAINSITLKSGISFTTIDHKSPIGICGTGIVDGIAQMLETGLIDETGRLNDQWKPSSETQANIADNLTVINNINSFILSGDIAITQKDIRELQNAKAAIAAGIHVLVNNAGISLGEIKNVYLAGGFGSYMNIESAVKIGLIPSELDGKIKSVGNAAGQGAIETLLSIDSLHQTDIIAKEMKYIELSASKEFNDLYVECMMFES